MDYTAIDSRPMLLRGANQQTVIVQLLPRETKARLVFTSPSDEACRGQRGRTGKQSPSETRLTCRRHLSWYLERHPTHQLSPRMFVVLCRSNRARVRSHCLPSRQLSFTSQFATLNTTKNSRPGRWVGCPGVRSRYVCREAARLAEDASDCTQGADGSTAFRNCGCAGLRLHTPAVWSPCSCVVAALQLKEAVEERREKKSRAIMVFESQWVSSGAESWWTVAVFVRACPNPIKSRSRN